MGEKSPHSQYEISNVSIEIIMLIIYLFYVNYMTESWGNNDNTYRNISFGYKWNRTGGWFYQSSVQWNCDNWESN